MSTDNFWPTRARLIHLSTAVEAALRVVTPCTRAVAGFAGRGVLLAALLAGLPVAATEPADGEPESGGPPHSEPMGEPESGDRPRSEAVPAPAPDDPPTPEPAPPDDPAPAEPAPEPTEDPPADVEPALTPPAPSPGPVEPAPPTPPPVDVPAEPAFTETRPTPTEPTEPEPMEAEPTEPEPREAGPTEPDPMDAEPGTAEPEPAPPPVEPKPAEPKPTHTPARAPAMVSTEADARELVEALLARARAHTLDSAWITAHVDARVSTSAANRWLAALRPFGPLELTLADCRAINTIVEGPGYRRAVLECRPPLSVLIRDRDGAAKIAGIELTACTDCDERRRFVEDLIAEVKRNGELGERLMPDFELVPADRGARDTRWESWSMWAEARMRADLSVAAAVGGARVVGGQDEIVRLRYPDGSEDTWRVTETPRGWAVIYDDLATGSPLRLPGLESRRWRKLSVRQEAAASTWTPLLRPVDGGTGVVVARHVLGAAWDAHDDTLLMAVLDREVPYALFVLVDIDGRAVLKRWAIPIPEANEVVLDLDAIPTQRVAFDPTGQRAAFAGFGHIWVLDRATDTVRDLGKVGKVSALAWSPAHSAFVWSTPTGALGGLPRDQAPAFTLPPAVGLHLGTDGNTLATVFGQLLTWRTGDPAPIAVPACPGSATGAARRPDGAWLVACGPGDRQSWTIAWPPGELAEPMGDVGGPSPAVAWSVTGRLLVAPAPPEAGASVVVWDTVDDQPHIVLGRYTAVSAAFSPDDSRLAVIDVRGNLTSWELGPSRRRAGVPIWRGP